MGLFERKPQTTSAAPLYSVGNQKTILVMGLGNPDKEHEGTRHNIGFMTLEHFAKANDFPGWTAKNDLKCHLTSHNLGESKVILVKPMTYMNNSGEAAQVIQHFYRIYNKDTLAVYDELAIPFGQLRTRMGGSDAGHNGVKSLIQHLGEDFSRLRIGIGSEVSQMADAANFVLSKFSQEEQASLPKILNEANVLITEFIFSGSLPHETRSAV
jgi:peptidyl-tRNA hydrolase, PTH1 family